QRHHTLLAAFAPDMEQLALEVDVAEIERDGLGTTQAARVDEFDQGRVPQLERTIPVESADQVFDLGHFRRIRQPTPTPRGQRGVRPPAGAEREAEERPNTCEPSRDRRRREAPAAASELGRVGGESAYVDLLEREPAVLQPPAEVAEI